MTDWYGASTLNGTGTLAAVTSAGLHGSATFNAISDLIGALSIQPQGASNLKPLSGVVVNQNVTPTSSRVVTNWAYQEFFLPSDYIRGAATSEQIIPDLTGVQLFVGVDATYADTATLDWTLQQYVFGFGWQTLTLGMAIGAHSDGNRVWFDIYFKESVQLARADLSSKFRIGFKGRTASASTHGQVVLYDGKTAFIGSTAYPATLEPGVPFPMEYLGVPGFLLLDAAGNKTTFSVQQGVNKAWFSTSPALGTSAYDADGSTVLLSGGLPISFSHRVLASTADSGVDFLGNQYRSAVARNKSSNVTALDSGVTNNFWMSQPNPSRFAVESLYFDMRESSGIAQVVDRIVLDPITPGLFFNVYYTNEAGTPLSEYGWEQKLWTRVPKTFRALRRDSYALPNPITAKFIKLEFTHLQAQSYQPGDFQLPILYKKHPKWVLDYFLIRLEAQRVSQDEFIARQTDVEYSALDIAYNYYLDDLHQEPDQPIFAKPASASLGDAFGNVDSGTLRQIELELAPFQQNPALRARLTDLFGAQNMAAFNRSLDYPTEAPLTIPVDTTGVSSTNRDAVIFENGFPVTYFYLTARHTYRQLSAIYSHDRAYFAGVREIAFTREHFNTVADSPLYIESAGDNKNVDVNDFEVVDFVWMTYNPDGPAA